MKFTSYILLFFAVTSNLLSQNCDTTEINHLNKESEKELALNVNHSYQLAFEAFSRSKKCEFSKHYFESLISLSPAYYQKDQGDSIIALLTPVLARLPKNTPTYYRAAIHHKLSSAYVMLLKLELGLKHCLEALKNFELIRDSSNISNMLVNRANCYHPKHNFNQANKYLRDAEKIALKLKKKT